MHAGSPPSRTKARTPHSVRLRSVEDPNLPAEERWVIARIAAERGLTLYKDKAALFGVTPTTYSRLVKGEINPGEEFIASVLGLHPQYTFDDLFEVA